MPSARLKNIRRSERVKRPTTRIISSGFTCRRSQARSDLQEPPTLNWHPWVSLRSTQPTI